MVEWEYPPNTIVHMSLVNGYKDENKNDEKWKGGGMKGEWCKVLVHTMFCAKVKPLNMLICRILLNNCWSLIYTT